MNSSSKSSLRVKVCLLKVHPKNITILDVCRKHLMSSAREFQWSWLIHKGKSDILFPQAKVNGEFWWFSKTCVGLDRKVARKKLGPHVYDEKPTHYCMETQVNLTTNSLWIVFWFLSQICHYP
jgi:hypothetical protein